MLRDAVTVVGFGKSRLDQDQDRGWDQDRNAILCNSLRVKGFLFYTEEGQCPPLRVVLRPYNSFFPGERRPQVRVRVTCFGRVGLWAPERPGTRF
jgi:hypothetical protein